MSDILEDVITNGTATGTVSIITNADGEYIATAGKTGTTDANLDKWFCGYTPYYCGAVWYGYDNRLRQTLIPTIDKPNANRIWYYVMSRIHQDLPGASWERPETVVEMEVCESGYYPSDYCREAGTTVTDLFVVGSYLAPTADNVCPIHTAPEEELPQQPGIEG
jgi:penicillin-binding protein 1A